MPDTTNDDKGIRLPRYVHRKRIKLMKRRQRRQQKYQSDTTNTSPSTLSQPQSQSQAQKEEDTALYLEQKAQWEEKERQYELINQARKKVIETEKKAREEAMYDICTNHNTLHLRMCIAAETEQVARQSTRSTYPKTLWVLQYHPNVFFEHSAAIRHPQNLCTIIIFNLHGAASAKNL